VAAGAGVGLLRGQHVPDEGSHHVLQSFFRLAEGFHDARAGVGNGRLAETAHHRAASNFAEKLDVLRLPAEEEGEPLAALEGAVVLDEGAADADVQEQGVLAVEQCKDRLGKAEALEVAAFFWGHRSGRIFKNLRQAYCCVCRIRQKTPEDSKTWAMK